MREINVSAVREAVERLYREACTQINPDVRNALEEALERETHARARVILGQLLENAEIAASTGLPICQDTGMAVVYIELGQDVHLTGGNLQDAVNEGVRRACRNAYLRASVVSALGRINTQDNTPCILHLSLTEGEGMRVIVAPKGFGSENKSAVALLTPAQGIQGIKKFVLETVKRAGGQCCPPGVIGIGIGGTMERCAYLSKKALLREIGTQNPDPVLAQLEAELLSEINQTGIGPMGLGGDTTALAVHILDEPTHIAGLPAAVNMQCHAARHKEALL